MPAMIPPASEKPIVETVPSEVPPVGEVCRVSVGSTGGRLDKALADALPALSRSRLRALIEAGHVSCGGRTIDNPSNRVKPGQTFEIMLPHPEPAEPLPQAMDLRIVYEDEAVLVLDKPAGLVVHPAAGNRDRTLVNALLAHCGDTLSGVGGVARPGIVHRLDKDTSGLMVVAKTDMAHRALSAQFADRTLSRTYLALVRGVPIPAAGVIDRPIGRDPRNRKRMAVVSRNGKPALTRYRVMACFGGDERPAPVSLVECALSTGRTHQIRVHMASIGHPILGDPLYGGRRTVEEGSGIGRQALHAACLRFVHPSSGKMMQWESEPPEDFERLVSHLGSMDVPLSANAKIGYDGPHDGQAATTAPIDAQSAFGEFHQK